MITGKSAGHIPLSPLARTPSPSPQPPMIPVSPTRSPSPLAFPLVHPPGSSHSTQVIMALRILSETQIKCDLKKKRKKIPQESFTVQKNLYPPFPPPPPLQILTRFRHTLHSHLHCMQPLRAFLNFSSKILN